MASLYSSRLIEILMGLMLLSLLVGIFYLGATLPRSGQSHPAEEQPSTPESLALEDLDTLDADRAKSDAGVNPGEDAALKELIRFIEENPEHFPVPCYVEGPRDTPSE